MWSVELGSASLNDKKYFENREAISAALVSGKIPTFQPRPEEKPKVEKVTVTPDVAVKLDDAHVTVKSEVVGVAVKLKNTVLAVKLENTDLAVKLNGTDVASDNISVKLDDVEVKSDEVAVKSNNVAVKLDDLPVKLDDLAVKSDDAAEKLDDKGAAVELAEAVVKQQVEFTDAGESECAADEDNMSKHDPRLLQDLNRCSDLEQYKRAVAAMKYYGARVGVACGDTRPYYPCSHISEGMPQNFKMGHPVSLPNTKICSKQEADKRIRGMLPPTLATASAVTYSHNAADCYYHVIPDVRPEELLSEDSSRDEVYSVQNYSSEECVQFTPEPLRQRNLTHPTKRTHSSPVKYSNANMPDKARNVLLSQSTYKTKIPVAEPNRLCVKETNAAYFAPNPPCSPITAFKSAPMHKRNIIKHRCLNLVKAEKPIDAEMIKMCEQAIEYAVKTGVNPNIPQAALKVIPPRKSSEAAKDKTSWRRRLEQLKSNRRLSERRLTPPSRKVSREEVLPPTEITETHPDSHAPQVSADEVLNPCSFETTCSEDSESVCSKVTLCDDSKDSRHSNATIKGSGSDSVKQKVSVNPADLAGVLLTDIEKRFSGQDNLCSDLKMEKKAPINSRKSGEQVAEDIMGSVNEAFRQRLEVTQSRKGAGREEGKGGAGVVMVSCDEAKLSMNLSALAKRFVERKPNSKYDSKCVPSPETYNTTASLKPPLMYVHDDFVDRIEVISPERNRDGALQHGVMIHEETIEEASSQPPESGDERSGYAHSTNTGLGFITHKVAHTTATYSRTSSRSDVRRKMEDGAGISTDVSTNYERLRDTPSKNKGVQVSLEYHSSERTHSRLLLNARSSHMSTMSVSRHHSRHESRAEKPSPKKSTSGRKLIADLEKSQRMLNLVDAALKDDEGTSSDGMGDTVLRVRSRKMVSIPRSNFDLTRCSDCARSLAPAECVRQLQVLRNEHIRHIQREIQQIVNLNQFLDNFDMQRISEHT